MACGDLLTRIGGGRMPLAAMRQSSPEDAAREALATYLERMVFLIPSAAGNVTFSLNSVTREWANEDEEKDEPCASIVEVTNERQHHHFVPTFRDSSWNLHGPGTVLVKVNERKILFQVDFWVTDKPQRQAIAAALDEYFCPEEGRIGVMIEGPSNYWSEPIRFRLDSMRGAERIDSSESAMVRDRRIIARVVAEIDDLQLRTVSELDPRVSLQTEGAPIEAIFPRPPAGS